MKSQQSYTAETTPRSASTSVRTMSESPATWSCRRFRGWNNLAVSLLVLHPVLSWSQVYNPPPPITVAAESEWASLVDSSADEHGNVLAAGFGFEGVASSMITIRTYHDTTGTVLSEESYDLNVREEGASSGQENHGRIFAGGIGMDGSGQSRFLLRVYDALTGKFLWEGQLNLRSQREEGEARPTATVVPLPPSTRRVAAKWQVPTQTHLSLRAIDPRTGGLVWEDRFIPGSQKAGRVEGIALRQHPTSSQAASIGHVFDLVVRTFDRGSGRLLWQDSFEELDQVDRREQEQESEARPQTLPPWNGYGLGVSSLIRTFTY